MYDPRALVEMGAEAVRRLARRGYTLDLSSLEELLSRRNKGIRMGDELRAESRRVAEEVQKAARAGDDVTKLKDRARQLKEQIRDVEAEQEASAAELREFLLGIPNLPSDDAPDGNSEEFAAEVRRHGNPPSFTFTPKDHVNLAEQMGILDFSRAAKLSGARFSAARGVGAALERALASYFLDLHISRHDYVEWSVPYLVSRETMTGTGQLPKFEADLFKTEIGSRDLFLIPTAEVPLTNLHADEIIDESLLPIAYTSWTPCYRSEAGSYGRDTRGILRLHQFSKVELVRICDAESSRDELATMVSHAEACLQGLDLAYRVVILAAGDIGFSAQTTYDIEVWIPSQSKYREISSCSDCGTFQSRRMNMRVRDQNNHKSLPATLNGSGLPIGRTMAALLENHQQEDGSVLIPKALVPYVGYQRINPDGTASSSLS